MALLTIYIDARVLPGAEVPDGTGQPIWLDNLRCRGNELRLVDCSHNAFGTTTSCSHAEDIGVACEDAVAGTS